MKPRKETMQDRLVEEALDEYDCERLQDMVDERSLKDLAEKCDHLDSRDIKEIYDIMVSKNLKKLVWLMDGAFQSGIESGMENREPDYDWHELD